MPLRVTESGAQEEAFPAQSIFSPSVSFILVSGSQWQQRPMAGKDAPLFHFLFKMKSTFQEHDKDTWSFLSDLDTNNEPTLHGLVRRHAVNICALHTVSPTDSIPSPHMKKCFSLVCALECTMDFSKRKFKGYTNTHKHTHKHTCTQTHVCAHTQISASTWPKYL